MPGVLVSLSEGYVDLPLSENGTVRIGRDPSISEVSRVEHDQRVSTEHCRFHHTKGTTVVTDVSTNGTYVNGERLGKRNQRSLFAGDVVSLCFSDWAEAKEGNLPAYRLQLHTTSDAPADAVAAVDTISQDSLTQVLAPALSSTQNEALPPNSAVLQDDDEDDEATLSGLDEEIERTQVVGESTTRSTEEQQQQGDVVTLDVQQQQEEEEREVKKELARQQREEARIARGETTTITPAEDFEGSSTTPDDEPPQRLNRHVVLQQALEAAEGCKSTGMGDVVGDDTRIDRHAIAAALRQDSLSSTVDDSKCTRGTSTTNLPVETSGDGAVQTFGPRISTDWGLPTRQCTEESKSPPKEQPPVETAKGASEVPSTHAGTTVGSEDVTGGGDVQVVVEATSERQDTNEETSSPQQLELREKSPTKDESTDDQDSRKSNSTKTPHDATSGASKDVDRVEDTSVVEIEDKSEGEQPKQKSTKGGTEPQPPKKKEPRDVGDAKIADKTNDVKVGKKKKGKVEVQRDSDTSAEEVEPEIKGKGTSSKTLGTAKDTDKAVKGTEVVAWVYQGDTDAAESDEEGWTLYPKPQSTRVENAFQRGREVASINNMYSVHFADRRQFQTRDKYRQRPVKRIVLTFDPWKKGETNPVPTLKQKRPRRESSKKGGSPVAKRVKVQRETDIEKSRPKSGQKRVRDDDGTDSSSDVPAPRVTRAAARRQMALKSSSSSSAPPAKKRQRRSKT